MVLHKGCAGNSFIEIGVVTAIITIDSKLLGKGHIVGSAQHVEMFVHRLKTNVPFIGYAESTTSSFLGGEHDNT